MPEIAIKNIQEKKNKKKSTKKQNKGEKAEVHFKKTIFELNNKKKYQELINIFGEEARQGITMLSDTGVPIQKIDDISKSPSSSKSDLDIKMNSTGGLYSISIKCFDGGKASILNHTTRNAKIFQEGGNLNSIIQELDILIEEYCKYRATPNGREEMNLKKLIDVVPIDNRDKLEKTIIKVILEFMFKASGKGPSSNPSNSLLEIKKNQYHFTPLKTDDSKYEYIKKNLERFDIALVSRKGLPLNINTKLAAEAELKKNNAYGEKYKIMQPWIYETSKSNKPNPDNKIFLKAALHIRISSFKVF